MSTEFLLELLSEEIPARMQTRAGEDLCRLLGEFLKAQGLTEFDMQAYTTPRRLCLVVNGLPVAQPDVTEERRGPKVGAPEKAVQGFLKANGVSMDDLEERETPKGSFYFLDIHKKGRATADVLKDALDEILPRFPWPKSMRWGERSERWVRPLEGIVCLFNGEVVPVAFAGCEATATTKGHRFLAPAAFAVKDFADYKAQLRNACVILAPAERRELIAESGAKLAAEKGLTVMDDPALLHEVAGLVEYPLPLLGKIDDEFMAVPSEVLSTSMRAHQKYFSLLDADGKMAPYFLVVANMRADDGGAQIVAGNERVLRARLSDARFFWDTDREARLDSRVDTLKDRIFHASLGSVFDKVKRIEGLARACADYVDCDGDKAARAAYLAKADLSTEMVGEFPELQGIMGQYYANGDGEDADVATAIAEHYSPQGPSDMCPTAAVSIPVAMADKIDSLVGFFAIDEKPTGSRDPYALRRAALGVIRLVLENKLRLPLASVMSTAHGLYGIETLRPATDVVEDLMDFFVDRLKVHLREEGIGHDVINAVFSHQRDDDLVRVMARIEALRDFLASEDGRNLLIAYRRAANIVRIEEKKDGVSFDAAPDADAFVMEQEKALFDALQWVVPETKSKLDGEDFVAAMAALASLRAVVDDFFADVTVNADDEKLRINRLRLLSRIVTTMGSVADFSRLEG